MYSKHNEQLALYLISFNLPQNAQEFLFFVLELLALSILVYVPVVAEDLWSHKQLHTIKNIIIKKNNKVILFKL